MQYVNSSLPFRIFQPKPVRFMFVSKVFKEDSVASSAVHIALLSQLGAAGRILVGEWFGGNCSQRTPNNDLSWIPCVTSSGLSGNHSGALFKDLPANMIGCFVMGCLTAPVTLRSLYPNFNPIQETAIVPNPSLLVGLRTGLCGSLTTFASWKLQMVQMLLAGNGTQLESQWLGVVLGLIIGLVTSLGALLMGQHFALLFINRQDQRRSRNSHIDTHVKESNSGYWSIILPLCSLVTLLLVCASALAGVLRLNGLEFWRKLCCSILLAPFGALLRWRLSSLNSSTNSRTKSLTWLPIGTLAANLVACCISYLSQGIETRWTEDLGANLKLILHALRNGFVGSLSTVSTWVVEVQSMLMDYFKISKGYLYVLISLFLVVVRRVLTYGLYL